jgi:hypothetical protein
LMIGSCRYCNLDCLLAYKLLEKPKGTFSSFHY